MVGVPGFEPGASWTRTKRDTKLRHIPIQLLRRSGLSWRRFILYRSDYEKSRLNLRFFAIFKSPGHQNSAREQSFQKNVRQPLLCTAVLQAEII